MGKQEQKKLGRRVLQMRLAKTWTQDEVARLAGISPKTVSNLERGNKVRSSTVREILAVFGDEGVQALRDVGYHEWADAVAEELEDGFDSRLEEAVRRYLRADPERVRKWLNEDT